MKCVFCDALYAWGEAKIEGVPLTPVQIVDTLTPLIERHDEMESIPTELEGYFTHCDKCGETILAINWHDNEYMSIQLKEGRAIIRTHEKEPFFMVPMNNPKLS